MKNLTVQAIHSQLPRKQAEAIIQEFSITDPENFVEVLKRWILLFVHLTDEFEEVLISPCRLILDIQRNGNTFGDCDDVSMLAASMLASIGARVRFAAVFPQEDGSYSHVIVQYAFPNEDWKDFDGTISFNPEYPPDYITEEVVS